MTAEWYRNHGYEISANFSDSVIAKAEKEVWDAYVVPVLPEADPEDEQMQLLFAPLAYYYLCLSNAKITRKGVKSKTDENSNTIIYNVEHLMAERASAYQAFYKIAAKCDKPFEVQDILQLWFTSAYVGQM